MKFGIGIIGILGLIVGGSLIVYGIRSNEAGFWMWVGFVILGIVGLRYYMARLERNRAARMDATLKASNDDVP